MNNLRESAKREMSSDSDSANNLENVLDEEQHLDHTEHDNDAHVFVELVNVVSYLVHVSFDFILKSA